MNIAKLTGAALMGFAVLTLIQPANAEIKRSQKPIRAFVKAHPCPGTGLKALPCRGYVIDHVIPLCAGGADHESNMQWQEYKESLIKDRAERRQCAMLRGQKVR